MNEVIQIPTETDIETATSTYKNGILVVFKKRVLPSIRGEVWEVLPSISQGIVDILRQVVNSNKIIQEPMIIDPSYVDL